MHLATVATVFAAALHAVRREAHPSSRSTGLRALVAASLPPLSLAQASARSIAPRAGLALRPAGLAPRSLAKAGAAPPPSLERALAVRGGGLWGAYTQLLDDKPLITKMCTSLLGFTIGDLLAQGFVEKSGDGIDWKRLTRMATFGFFCHATTGHYFYNFLDAQIPKVTPLTVALKVLIDQTMWAPLFMVMFFSYGCLFDGTPELIAKKCKNDIFTAVKGSWFTWVPAHTINFALIPTEQRLLYINTVQIFFNIFMSVISNKKVD